MDDRNHYRARHAATEMMEIEQRPSISVYSTPDVPLQCAAIIVLHDQEQSFAQ